MGKNKEFKNRQAGLKETESEENSTPPEVTVPQTPAKKQLKKFGKFKKGHRPN
ncbi:MAG: hypothetical protein LBD46_06625 [Endomicrobium sp.]|jgi:hypothetical protein|nr:hypothetical protein [Endomicrobium sp.]